MQDEKKSTNYGQRVVRCAALQHLPLGGSGWAGMGVDWDGLGGSGRVMWGGSQLAGVKETRAHARQYGFLC